MRIVKGIVAICLFSATIFSCSEEDSGFGTQFFNGTSFEFTTWDTLSVDMTTIILDSLPTNNYGKLLVGQHNDPYFGQIESISYFQVTLDAAYEIDETDHRYDSITIVFDYEDYYYYDSSQIKTLEVYRLEVDLELDDDGLLYNTSSFNISDDPLATISFAPKPNSEETIEARIDDQLGIEIFNSNELNLDILTDGNEFLDYLKGFALKSVDDNAPFIGLLPTAQLRIYYTDFNAVPSVQEYLTFSMNGEIYFNQIISDKSATYFSDINNQEDEVISGESENLCFMQAGIGIGIKIELPYLKTLLIDNPDLLINDIFIRLYPKLPGNNSAEFLPEEITVFKVDRNNEIYEAINATFPLIYDDELDRDTYYEIDITQFVEDQLEISANNENALLITLPWEDYSSTVSQLIVGDQEHNELGTSIILNLISLKE